MKTRRGTDTAVGQRLAADANQEYKIRLRDCRAVLGNLEKALKEHERRQAKDPNNYGYVGDLGHARNELLEVVRFLAGQG